MPDHDTGGDVQIAAGCREVLPEVDIVVRAPFIPFAFGVGQAAEPWLAHLLQRIDPDQGQAEMCRVHLQQRRGELFGRHLRARFPAKVGDLQERCCAGAVRLKGRDRVRFGVFVHQDQQALDGRGVE